MAITDLLDQILDELVRLGAPVVDLLEPAVARGSRRVRGLPPEVEEFFSWRGGTQYNDESRVGDGYFIPGYLYPALSTAADYRANGYESNVLGNWFPLFVSPGGDYLAAVWGEDMVVRVADVLVGEDTEIRFDSIEQLLQECLGYFQSGAIYVTNDGDLEVHEDAPGYDGFF